MKKGIFLKVKVLTAKEYRRLARILKLRIGNNFDSARAILHALDYDCEKIDEKFRYEVRDIKYSGCYEPESHIIYLSQETFDKAYEENADALFTIVHEISHWALISVFGIKPAFVIFALPLILSSITIDELYADTFSCYLMIPQTVTNGCRKKRTFLRKILRPKKAGTLLQCPF